MHRRDIPIADIESERAVIGACLLNADAVATVQAAGLTPDDFSDSASAAVCRAIFGLSEAGRPCDIVLVRRAMEESGELGKIGGAAGLSDLLDQCPAACNVEHYASVVLEKSRARRLMLALMGAMDSLSGSEPIENVRTAVMEAVEASMPNASMESGFIGEFLRRGIGLSASKSLPWAWPALTRATGGLPDGALTIIGAYPAAGKTALAATQAAHLALQNTPIGFFSCEMAGSQIIATILARDAGVSAGKLRFEGAGAFTGDTARRLGEAVGRVCEWPFLLAPNPASATEIAGRARVWAHRHGVRAVFVDFLQLLRVSGNAESRRLAIDASVQTLKMLASETGVAVVLLSQLRRTQNRAEADIGDLKESQHIEEAADLVLLVRRPKQGQSETCQLCAGVYGRNPNCPDCAGLGVKSLDDEMVITVGKSRFGAAGSTVRLAWNGPTMCISSWEGGIQP